MIGEPFLKKSNFYLMEEKIEHPKKEWALVYSLRIFYWRKQMAD